MESGRNALAPTFSLDFSRGSLEEYELKASQVLPVPRERAFSFFEEPANLYEITPDWLDFRSIPREEPMVVHEGAEFDYTIRWLGLRFGWRSRILEYTPPERFVDIQVMGPYRLWRHEHVFEEMPEGTRMRDHVTYRLPFGLAGNILHALLVREQLSDIFRYRAVRIDEWARRELARKGRGSGSKPLNALRTERR